MWHVFSHPDTLRPLVMFLLGILSGIQIGPWSMAPSLFPPSLFFFLCVTFFFPNCPIFFTSRALFFLLSQKYFHLANTI